MRDERDAQAEAHHQLMLEREHETADALQRCHEAGADPEVLKVLARECGLSNWKPSAHRRAA